MSAASSCYADADGDGEDGDGDDDDGDDDDGEDDDDGDDGMYVWCRTQEEDGAGRVMVQDG
jgi:hypothetical protein